jgi:hypothetical protein
VPPDATNATPKKGRRDWKPAFLDCLQKTCSVSASASASGVERSTVYRARTRDERFAAAWDEAIEAGVEMLELALRRMAFAGNVTAAIFLLKAHRPEKYRETHRHEIGGLAGGPVHFTLEPGRPLTDADE